MEYDPAFPTDEPEDLPVSLDLSSIPLPEPVAVMDSQFLDIPLPTAAFDAPDIPLPPVVPVTVPAKIEAPTEVEPENVETVESDTVSGPLKFSIKMAKSLTGQDGSGDSSGIFESSKDVKNEETKSMPKLQAMMKRSKPCQLPVGVLPAKVKLPPTETKSELFLPSKDEANGNALLDNPQVNLLTQNNVPVSIPGTSEAGELLPNANTSSGITGVAAVPNDSVSTLGASVHGIPESSTSLLSNLGMTSVSLSSLSSVLPASGLAPSAHIPNLMSLTVQPVPINTLPATVSTLPVDHTALLRQPKMNMANMQYVNPQKLRSAQMIATPLIANPALAGQHQSEEQSKKRESRRRSRSRTRSRSSSRRRGRYRDSSSSASSSPRRSTYRYRRRSRSRRSRSSSGRYSRNYDSARYSRDKRDSDRRRDTRRERSNSLNNSRDSRRDRNQMRKRSRSKESANRKESRQPDTKSRSRPRSDQPRDVVDRKDSRPKEKSHQVHNSTSLPRSKENSSRISSSKSNHRSEAPDKRQSSRRQDDSRRTSSTKSSDKPHRQTLADLLEREQRSDIKRFPVKEDRAQPPTLSESSSSETCGSPDRINKSVTTGQDKTTSSHESDSSSDSASEQDSSSDAVNDLPPGEFTGNEKELSSRGRNSPRKPPLKTSALGKT